MELYCIKTHSQKAVVAGNIYPLKSNKGQCNCDTCDVGIIRGDKSQVGRTVTCSRCYKEYVATDVWYISKKLFANIDEINIEEAIECINEVVII